VRFSCIRSFGWGVVSWWKTGRRPAQLAHLADCGLEILDEEDDEA